MTNGVKWNFSCRDNGGKFQAFTVTAKSKDEAISKGLEKARKHAKGDIGVHWKCSLRSI